MSQRRHLGQEVRVERIAGLLKVSHSLILNGVSSALVTTGITFTQWLVLVSLHQGGGMTPSELGRRVNHDSGALTRLVDQLHELGYIGRERSDEDRRVVELTLTGAGRRKVGELSPLIVSCLSELLSRFTEAEFDELTALLSKLITTLQPGCPPAAGSRGPDTRHGI